MARYAIPFPVLYPPLPTLPTITELSKAQHAAETTDFLVQSAMGTPEWLQGFAVGDFVVCSYPERSPSKLHLQWEGPFRVVETADDIVKIQNTVNLKIKRVHITRLKPFFINENNLPSDIARHDYQEQIVERVLNHLGPKTQKSKMQFQVRWLGFGEDQDLWLPWSELRDNPALHNYLRDNKMDRLIPREHNIIKKKIKLPGKVQKVAKMLR